MRAKCAAWIPDETPTVTIREVGDPKRRSVRVQTLPPSARVRGRSIPPLSLDPRVVLALIPEEDEVPDDSAWEHVDLAEVELVPARRAA